MHEWDLSSYTISRIDGVMRVDGRKTEHIDIGGLPSIRFGPRRYHGLVMLLTGANRYVVEERYVLEAQVGTMLYLPQGREYYVQSLQTGECLCVNFHFAEDISPQPFLFRLRSPALWQTSFESLLRCWNAPRPGSGARCRAILYDMLAMMEEDRHAEYLPHSKVQLLQSAVSRMESIGIAQLAAECGMSETYFRRLFRKLYGVSPKQYVNLMRMQRAKALLTGTNETITEIARLCGFENVYYFSRFFHSCEGISPSEYRAQP